MRSGYAWFAYCFFAICMVCAVASYLWSDGFLWWPLLFSALGVVVIAPIILGPPIRAVISALR
ncbi:MAG: hypothetical protein QM714_18815 [Nocardioides sp.]|uniref:hypothetical protein n=1 Tax=Nocardioides sp. TaxID=35761 RepID=UPI0039E61AD0